jgi:hypothetical protein
VLGWQLGSIRRGASRGKSGAPLNANHLLRLDGLPPAMQAELAVDLIDSNRQRLTARLTKARGIDPKLVTRLRIALTRSPSELQCAVEELHKASLFALTAADSRLGRAYILGHELADTCLGVNDAESFRDAFGREAVQLKNQLSDLASSFPPHSSRAVVLSVRAWEAWAAKPNLHKKRIRLPGDWGTQGAAIEDALRRQGELWRDLLAGDKDGQDMLDTDHYLQAGRSLVASMTSSVWEFLKAMWRPFLTMGLICLLGLYLLFSTGAAGKVVGLFLTVLGGLGITGAGVRTQVGKVAGELQSQLWGVALDRAIAEAVLRGPAGWDATIDNIDVPASGAELNLGENIKTLSEFREHVEKKSRRKIRKLLAHDTVFRLDTDTPMAGDDKVAKWLRREPQRARIADTPDSVEELSQGVLLSCSKEGGAAIWRLQEGLIRRWSCYPTREKALATARDLGLTSVPRLISPGAIREQPSSDRRPSSQP